MKLKPIITPGMIESERPEMLRLDLDALSRHTFIAGGTGSGKTKLSVLLTRQFITYGLGVTVITPHPDVRAEVFPWCAANKIAPARILDLNPGTDCCVSLDPFARMPEGLNRLQEEAWLQSQTSRFISAMLSNVPLADQEVMNQLHTWLKNVLYCCGKRVDGEYLGLQKSLMLLNPDDPEFDPALDRLWPHLPEEIRFDYLTYRTTKNVNQRRAMVQSTVNRLRRVIFPNPLVTQMFAKRANAINDEEIITGNKIQIVSVPDTDDLPREPGNVIARMRISAMIAAAKRIASRVPEHLRQYHFLIIDEAENFIGEDLRTAFQELRKFRMPIIIIVQDISCLMKGDMDLLPKVVSQCGLQGTFQQQDPDSLEYLAKAFAYRFLRIVPLYTKQVLPGGYQMIQLQGVSFSSTQGVSVSEAESMTQTRSVTHQESSSQSMNRSISEGLSQTHTEGDSSSSSFGGSKGIARGASWGSGQTNSRQLTHSRGTADSVQHGSSETRGTSTGRSTTETAGTSKTRGTSRTEGESSQVSDTVSNGVSEQRGESESHGASKSTGTSTGRSQQNSTSRSEGTSDQDSSGTSHTKGDARSRVIGELKTTQNLSANNGVSHSHSSGRSTSATSGSSEGSSENETKSTGETHTKGTNTTLGKSTTTGRSVGHGTSRSTGSSESEAESLSRGNSQSEGRSHSTGTSEGRGHSVTNGVCEGTGTADSRTRGGSRTVSEQENWTQGTGRNSSDSSGLTRTQSDGTGQTRGTSQGHSDGRSTGNTTGLAASQSNGTTISYSQSPLPIQYVIEVPTGRLEESVQDQIASFIQCIASLPDRTLLMKCRGVNVPFVLRVHDVSDPYGTAFRCAEWRADDLRKYIAEIRKAHPCYFLPGLGDEEEVPVPVIVEKKARRKKQPEPEESPF